MCHTKDDYLEKKEENPEVYLKKLEEIRGEKVQEGVPSRGGTKRVKKFKKNFFNCDEKK